MAREAFLAATARDGRARATIGSVLDRDGGIGRGFDTLRVVLSVAILCWHSIATSYGRNAELPFWSNVMSGGTVGSLLPVFFALSGFLVMGSAVRTMSLSVFLSSRILRIVPALATEITLSAVLLGAAVTSLSTVDYYTSAGFARYFGSLIGKIQYSLPGVFTTNPLDNVVNASLWTLATEIFCYTFMAFVIATGLLGRRGFLSLFLVAATLGVMAAETFLITPRHMGDTVLPPTLFAAYAVGNLVFLWRHRIPFNCWLFIICLLAGGALASQTRLITASTPFLAYVAVYLGLLPLPRLPVLGRGDYSYGIYIYAMPVQQTFVFAFPQLRVWYANIAFALPVTIMLAMASWAMVETPALRLRSRLGSQAARRRGKHVVRSSLWTVATIVAYGVWLISTQYDVPVITPHRIWVFAAAVLLLAGAFAAGHVFRSREVTDGVP